MNNESIDNRFEIIETQRLHLRKLTPKEYEYIFKSLEDFEIAEIFRLQSEAELVEEKRKFREGIHTYRTSYVNFQMIEKKSGKIIGACGFHTWYTEHDRAEIGYQVFDEENKMKGYMKEAMDAVIRYGFEIMKLNRIEAYVSPTNEPSLKLMAGYNFVREGHLREHYRKEREIQDSLVFGLLKRDYDR